MPLNETTVQRTFRQPRPARRWRVPPPFMHGAEPMEGATVLEEVPGPFGTLLWHCMRDVTLWAATPAERREGLFAPEAEQRRLAALLALGPPARALEAPLRAVAAMLSHAPDTAPEAMMLACGRVSQWAEAEGHLGTALAFAQASALAVPAAARPALRVGRLARQRGEYARAEGWLQRAIVLARQGGEREVHAWGYTALGQVYHRRGNLPAAERHHARALRIARRFSLISREAASLHELFFVSLERGQQAAALNWARQALAAYGPFHPHLYRLAHDVALMWLEAGQFGLAAPVFKRVAQRAQGTERAIVLCNLVRAAGGLGDRGEFDRSWVAARAELHGVPRTVAASPLLALARGASSLGLLELAHDTALQARAIAAEAGESKTTFEVDALLQSLSRETGRPDQEAGAEAADELSAAFADELVNTLALVGS